MALRLLARGWRNGLAAGALVGLAAVSSTAHAESMFGFFSSDANPAEVAANINRHGFVIRSAMVRRGDIYVVDVSDYSGQMERLIIDAHSGMIAQRYASRAAYARRPEPPRYIAPGYGYDAPDEDSFDPPAPRPLANIPAPRPPVYAPSLSDAELRAQRERELAYGGDGRGPAANPPALDAKPLDKPKPKIARPKPAASPSGSPSLDASAATPASTARDVPSTAVARPKPDAVKEAPPPKEAAVAPTPANPPSEAAKPAATPPKTEGVMASTGGAASPPPPTPAPTPAAKRKAINDIPVTPLD